MDELTLLRAMHTDTGNPTEAALERGREHLLHHIAESQMGAPGTRKNTAAPGHRRRLGLRIAVSSAAAASLAAALVVGDVLGPAAWRGGATAEAAEVLDNAALATVKVSDPVVGPGEYLKVDTTSLSATFSTLADKTELVWLDTDRNTEYIPANRSDEWVWLRYGRVPTTFFDDASKAYAQKMYRRTDHPPQVMRGRNGALDGSYNGSAPARSSVPTADLLASLPRDPYRLLNDIYRRTLGQGLSMDGEALVFIADLLRTNMVPADLRAALYKSAAMIPGVLVADRQAALDGRIGVAIGRVEDVSHTRQDIIIDPATGLLIGERDVLTQAQGKVPAGTTIEWTTVKTEVSHTAP